MKDLKDHTGLTDDELSKEITESHLNKIADLIDNYEQFAEAFQLKPWRVTEIKADPNLNYIMKTQAVLKQWRQDHPFKATYLNLVLVALELSEGTLATKICEYCKGEQHLGHCVELSQLFLTRTISLVYLTLYLIWLFTVHGTYISCFVQSTSWNVTVLVQRLWST